MECKRSKATEPDLLSEALSYYQQSKAIHLYGSKHTEAALLPPNNLVHLPMQLSQHVVHRRLALSEHSRKRFRSCGEWWRQFLQSHLSTNVHLENLLELPDAVILPILTPVLPLCLPHCLRLLRVRLDPLLLLMGVLLLELLKLSLKLPTLLQLEN